MTMNELRTHLAMKAPKEIPAWFMPQEGQTEAKMIGGWIASLPGAVESPPSPEWQAKRYFLWPWFYADQMLAADTESRTRHAD